MKTTRRPADPVVEFRKGNRQVALNSPLFLLSALLCAAVHAALPQRRQNLFLLLASFAFYFWAAPQYGALLLATLGVVYAGARWLNGAQPGRGRRLRLAAVMLPLFGALGVLKYSGLIARTAAAALGLLGLQRTPFEPGWVLPVGISFYTFQAAGYCIDVYRGDTPPERDFVDFALFLSFFPQLTSGPIGRAGELLGQYKRYRPFSYAETVYGLRRFLLGMFKKTVAADGLGLLVNAAYAMDGRGGGICWFAMLAYGLQLYFDFSGYSDMAVGAARLFGIRLRENFLAPYFAPDIASFWRRWHRSLTDWFRDYLYIPLGGGRAGLGRKLLNILLVFALSGLWHGASWTFLAWGLLHAAARIAQELLRRVRPARPARGAARAIRALLVYLFACFALVPFRAPNLRQAAAMWAGLFRPGDPAQWAALWESASPGITLGTTYTVFFFGVLGISLALCFLFDLKLARSLESGAPLLEPLGAVRPRAARWLLYWFMALSSMLFLFLVETASSGAVSFIYRGF